MKLLIAYFAQQGLAPPEVQPDDTDREKTYLVDLPEDPDNIFLFRETSSRVSRIHPILKRGSVKRLQCIIRNTNQGEAFAKIEALYKFIIRDRDEMIEELNSEYKMILDCSRGPWKLSIDEKGRHLWSLAINLTTI